MKKLVMAAAVLTCASIVTAQTQSQNIVGYTKVTVDSGTLALVALNFDSPTTLQDLIGTSVPGLSVVYKWNKLTSSYDSASLNTRGAWGPNLTLDIGDAFFIQPGGSGTHEIVVPGEVLGTDATNAIPTGVTALGIQYPITQPWQNTALSGALPGLSVLYVWDQVGQGYVSYSKNTRGVWSGNPVIDTKEGFFVDNPGGPLSVVEANPVP
jgi:hypothetical protein